MSSGRQLQQLYLAELHLQRVLGRSKHSLVQEGLYFEQPAAVKIVDTRGWQPSGSFLYEAHIYSLLPDLQANGTIPRYLGHGLTAGGTHYFMALSIAPGTPLSTVPKPYPTDLQNQVMCALDALHKLGFIHGDLCDGRNVMVEMQQGQLPRVTLVDLEQTRRGSDAEIHAEAKQMRHLLGWHG